MAGSSQWEYRVFSSGTSWAASKDEEMEATLNQLGEECWEVVAVYPLSGGTKARVIAKRPLDLRERRRRSLPSIE